MKLSLSFLKRYLKTNWTPTELADKMTAIGLEVEEIIDRAAALDGIIIGEIVSKEKHPNADKLNVLSVFDGTKNIQIVCGAPNCYVGMKSALALPGTLIPQYGEKLEKGLIRGIESRGMMCSERELNLGNDHTGILDIKTDLPAGTPVAQALNADVLFDVNVTPNRGDCYGVAGIARDLAAAGAGELMLPDATPVAGAFISPVTVTTTDSACPLFTGRLIRGVKNGPSPEWMQNLLVSVGLRPISALVDVTNFLNIALCRPLHVFDAGKLTGNLTVRSAKDGETLVALDDKTYTLSAGMTVVADESGPQSIAGVMGGTNTGCTPETTDVFLESAWFDPIRIAQTARTLNIESDSKARFERGVDPLSTRDGLEIATRLILDICGGTPSKVVTAGQLPDTKRTITFDFNLVERLCGFAIPKERMIDILTRLGFTVDGSCIDVPSWRQNDVREGADLVEEIVRIHGLDDMPEHPLRPDQLGVAMLPPAARREAALRRSLAARGLNQVITWSFMDSKKAALFGSKGIVLTNPIASDLDEMRPSLLPNLLSAVARNQDHGTRDVPLFEVGPVFTAPTPGAQQTFAAAVRAGNWNDRHFLQPARTVDVFDIKADLMDALAAVEAPQNAQITGGGAPAWYHPGRSGTVALGKNVLAWFGEIHPALLKTFGIKTPVVAFELNLNALPPARDKAKAQKALKMSDLMPLTRDFAFVMDESVTAGKVISAIRAVNKDLITDVSVFDVYTGDKLPAGKKQLAVQVTLWPRDKTLTDQEIEVVSTQIINLVAKNTGAVLRA